MYKKANYNNNISMVPSDPQVAQLQSLGMRIRKAVSEGYMVPRNENYMGEFERQQQQQQQQQSFQRVPLPSHLNQPPALSYGQSSTLEGESFINSPMMSLQRPESFQASPKKRSRDEDEGLDLQQDYQDRVNGNPVNNKDVPMEYFESKYGSLSFNEEF